MLKHIADAQETLNGIEIIFEGGDDEGEEEDEDNQTETEGNATASGTRAAAQGLSQLLPRNSLILLTQLVKQ